MSTKLISTLISSSLFLTGLTTIALPESVKDSSAFANPLLAQAATKRAVVLDFYNGDTGSSYWSGYYYGGGAAGNGLSQKMIEGLLDSGKVRVADRGVITKYDWYRTATSEALQAAKDAGIDYVIVGTVSNFDVTRKRSGGSAFGISVGGKKTTANVELRARIIETQFGDIVATAKGAGEAKKGDGNLSIRGRGGSSSSSVEEQLLDAAVDQAMESLMTDLIGKL
ncbi:MAG: CsgG/HfaB family protein [Cyanobacteria bacterium P01_F01_bin.42]